MKKFEHFKSNLKGLVTGENEDLSNEFIVGGIIDKFFVQFELGWKVLKELLSYEEDQKKQLEDILSKMSGVGQVVVTIHFESGETQVPATNSSTQTSETQEEDTNGGTRLTKQETEGTTVVMKSDSNSSEPFITKTYKPAVTGVLIVAEGAKSSEIKYNIQKAVSKLYDISLEQVNVYPMKE